MSHFYLLDKEIEEELNAEFDSSYSEVEDLEIFSTHETDSEEDADVVSHEYPSIPLPPVEPLAIQNWRETQVSSEYLEDIPLYYIRRDEFTGRDGTKWNVFAPPSNVRTRSHNIIISLPGPIGEARNCTSIVQAWNFMFPPEFISKIVIYTNIYIEKRKEQYSRDRDCKVTNEIELRALFGLLYYIGRLRGAHLNTKDLWTTDGTGCIMCIATMSRKRFLFLLRSIRFDDIGSRDERRAVDKFAPLREIYNDFNANIKKYYSLGPHVTINDKLEKIRGWCPFRQYIPSKPGKYDVKLHLMADSKTFYTYNIEHYVGDNVGPYQLNNSASKVVKRLVEPIRGSHRNVVMDNWYISIPLYQDLLKDYGLTALGTIKKNKRQIPDLFLRLPRREQYSSFFGFQNDYSLVSYVPRRGNVVLLLSSMHHDTTIDPSTAKKKKPEIITDYNRYKCGVDVVDELCGTYSVSRVTKRWPLVLFYGFMNIAGINAYVIVKQNKENSNQMSDSRRECIRQLALELILPLVRERKLVSNLPREIKSCISLVIGKEGAPEENTQRVLRPVSSSSRCSVCNWKKDRKTKTSCKFCSELICKEHTIPICDNCYQGRK